MQGMFASLIIGVAAMMASIATGESEADPQYFYNPSPYFYPYNQLQYHPYFYAPVNKAYKTVVIPAQRHEIRQIIPVFDYLRSGEVAYFRPDQAPKVQPEQGQQQKIVSYSIPYTQAYLNRVPAPAFY